MCEANMKIDMVMPTLERILTEDKFASLWLKKLGKKVEIFKKKPNVASARAFISVYEHLAELNNKELHSLDKKDQKELGKVFNFFNDIVAEHESGK